MSSPPGIPVEEPPAESSAQPPRDSQDRAKDHAVQGHGPGDSHRQGLAILALGALGVVYGDIGTSPLYALKECFLPGQPHSVRPTPENVIGILSLFFWTLFLVVV